MEAIHAAHLFPVAGAGVARRERATQGGGDGSAAVDAVKDRRADAFAAHGQALAGRVAHDEDVIRHRITPLDRQHAAVCRARPVGRNAPGSAPAAAPVALPARMCLRRSGLSRHRGRPSRSHCARSVSRSRSAGRGRCSGAPAARPRSRSRRGARARRPRAACSARQPVASTTKRACSCPQFVVTAPALSAVARSSRTSASVRASIAAQNAR